MIEPKHSNKAVFLDRDGVINKKRNDYVKSVDEFVFLPNVFKVVKTLNEMDYLIIIVTNQSAVNRGIISEKELKTIHNFMLKKFKGANCTISGIYVCPHRPDENCECRKPKTALLQKAIKDFQIDVSNSWLIGDSNSDIEAAKKMGLRTRKIQENGNILKVIEKIIEIS